MLEQQKELNSRLKNKMAKEMKPNKIEIKNTGKEKKGKAEEKIKELKQGKDKIAEKQEEKTEIKAEKEDNKKTETPKIQEDRKTEEKSKETEKKPVQEKPTKTEAVVKAYNLPISTKYSAAICKFIKNKRIEEAITDLEQVLKFKKAIPMKGEIPHRKGRGIMSGRFPKKATESFIKLLKNLSANASHGGLEEPVIAESVANIGSRPYGKFGAVRKKRTHVRITVKNKEKK